MAISIGPTAIMILVIMCVCLWLYYLAYKVDKEDELSEEWKKYEEELASYNYWRYKWQLDFHYQR